MNRRPRVLVTGAFGQGNPGDESVLAAFLSHLDGCEVAATVAPQGTPPAGMPPAGSSLAGTSPADLRPVPSSDRLAVARAVMGADLTVVTATVFKTLHPSSGRPPLGLLVNTAALAGVARALGRPVALVGVGAGALPGRPAKALARGIVAAAGHVEIRDEESAQALHRAGVERDLPVGADVVWATLPRSPAGRRRGNVAVIALSHLAGDDRLVSSLQATAAELVAAGYEVALQPWQAPRDLSLAAAIAATDVPVRIWEQPADVAAAARSFEDVSLVIGLRFHSLVAAGAAGVPFVAVAHEPKLAALARRLGQQAVPPSAAPDVLAGAAVQALLGPGPAPELVRKEREVAARTLGRTRTLAFTRAAALRAAPRRLAQAWRI